MSTLRIRTAFFLGVLGAMGVIAGRAGSDAIHHDAIQYTARPVDDVVARLQRRIDSGEVKLEFSDRAGYLESVLKALGVRTDSQVLVFSKTSFQAPRIAPRLPRAIYFNDEVSVGWVRGGDVLEFAAVDPKQGVIFYTLYQEPSAEPRIRRQDGCLQCHDSGGTLGVPGMVVRSVYPDRSGMPVFRAGTFTTDHTSPFKERWGGWYVTGKHGAQTHMGNAIVRDGGQSDELETEGAQNVTDLRKHLDTGFYLTPHSDIVALMTLEHQTRMTNLITRGGFEARMALHDRKAMNVALGYAADAPSESTTRRINSAAEELVEYMLFGKEARLTAPVSGTSGFADNFAKQGPRDQRGRSLRDFDLKTRLFRHPCSYLIYSDAFNQMPAAVKDRVYLRLWEVLSGKDTSKPFAHLTATDRQAVLDILLATKRDLPPYWLNKETEPRP